MTFDSSKVKTVLALDPGDRVGWATAEIDVDGRWISGVSIGNGTLEWHGIEDLKACALYVDRAIDTFDVVVCERWALYPHMAQKMVGSEIPSAQFIGMVKLSCWKAGVPLVMQYAKDVNSNRPGHLAPAEASMKKLRPELFELVTQPGAHDDLHDMVAIKHLWYWTWKNYPEVSHADTA